MSTLAWALANKEKMDAYYAGYRASHKETIRARAAEYRESHKDRIHARQRDFQVTVKMEALNAYGGPRCACCGFDLIEGLTIDHVGGNGAEHRRQLGGKNFAGAAFYAWLKRNNYPPGFQVLCGGCNLAKGAGDHCPHKDRERITNE